MTVPKSTDEPHPAGPARQEPGTAADWQAMLAYLATGGPAEIATYGSARCVHNRARFYEALAVEPTSPCLTQFILKANDSGAKNAYLIVTTGEKSQVDLDWNYNAEPIRDRVLRELSLPIGRWEDMVGEGCGSYANHSKPGCSLASPAAFNNLARQTQQGQYKLERVIRPAHSPHKRAHRWDVQVFGEEVARPELACELCGENRVALGYQGSHLICRRCGVIYCRRNCQASIHGQCPRCGETDKIDGVSESDVPAPTHASRAPTQSRSGPLNMESVIAELTQLVGVDNSGFTNKARIREIGEDLNGDGGIELMRKAYYAVRNTGIYFSQDIWDGIGSWRC